MKPQDVQVGKTYYGRRGGMARRTVLAITEYDTVTVVGRVRGTPAHENDKVVQYRTNSAKPTIEYLWLTNFAYWAGAVVGAVVVRRQSANAAQVLPLTDEVRQDASTADGAVAYMVFTAGEDDYRVFTDQSEAVAVALDEVVRDGSGEKWRVYPLYAGAPITG